MTPDPSLLLSVRELRTHFLLDEGLVVAVDGASFDVHAGRTLGIVGESGCGKSVTARSILGILDRPGKIAGGEVRFRRRANGNGEEEWVDLAKLAPDGAEMRKVRGGEIALVFQEPMSSFSPVHTVGAQLMEAIRIHRHASKTAARRIGIELLRQVGIPDPGGRIDAYSLQLSGGLRQRAMIATALAGNPRLLVADEPTTALDVTTQAQILDLLRNLQRRNGMAIMLITHDLGVIAEMADEVVVMYLGWVVESAPVDEIFYGAKHPYTRTLIKAIPSISAPPGEKLATIAGSVPHPGNRPTGCPFHPRCPSFIPGTCDRKVPNQTEVSPGHAVRCFLYGNTETTT
ncbi:ABC transporter ATP-binding protein [Bradyrhizobium sp. BR 1432]|uniref:ABC transporter ATP-binding protein n=1 Tax=Bradyrhizobium sp. BR 1432 TaxID=3447966 RepID=UPI003EE6A32A